MGEMIPRCPFAPSATCQWGDACADCDRVPPPAPAPLLPPLLADLEDIEDDEFRAIACLIRHNEHVPYTHRHAGEPNVTYCLRCRATL